MKTFNQLTAGDKIWYGHKERDFETIKKVEDARDGKVFTFTERDSVTRQRSYRIMIPTRDLNGTEHASFGMYGSKVFSCREAAIENEIKKYRHTIHCIEGEIDLKRKLIEKHEAKIAELEKTKES